MSCTPSIPYVLQVFRMCLIYISYVCTAAHDILKSDALLPETELVTALYNWKQGEGWGGAYRFFKMIFCYLPDSEGGKELHHFGSFQYLLV